MSDPPERHPLDSDDEPIRTTDTRKTSSSGGAYQPLLKPSIVALLISFAIAFTAGVAASNAAPNSAAETIGSTINRLGIFGMLIAFFCILLAYRLPYLEKLMQRSPSHRWFDSGYLNLVLVNVAGIVGLWIMLYLLSTLFGVAAMTICVALLLVAGSALLITMIIWHSNYLRAYAVGALVVTVATIYSGAVVTWTFVPVRGGRGGISLWSAGIMLTAIASTGLLCAGYVRLLNYIERWRKDTDSDSAPTNVDR